MSRFQDITTKEISYRDAAWSRIQHLLISYSSAIPEQLKAVRIKVFDEIDDFIDIASNSGRTLEELEQERSVKFRILRW